MKFLIDENIGRKVVQFLNQLGYPTNHIQDIQIGFEDFQILDLAVLKNSVIITFDKDFGELVFKESKSHKGVVLLRLEDQTSTNTIRSLREVLKQPDKIEGYFVVVTESEKKLKIRRIKN